MLQVKPVISVTGDIQLDLTIEDSTFTLVVVGLRRVPEVTVSSATSSMLVRDGATMILGGLRGGTREGSVDKVPIIGDIPLIGRAFRTTHTKDRLQELLIFITPTITMMGSSPRADELEQARENFQRRGQEAREWPLGKIRESELPPLPPVSPREETDEDSATEY
jgi:type II secretory pathway component GspD/PulD (secretin)